MGDLVERPFGVEVHEDPHDRRHRPLDRDLPRAHQGDESEPHLASCLGREYRPKIIGRREQDADQVVLRHAVAVDHRGKQTFGRGQHGRRGILSHDDRASRGSNPHPDPSEHPDAGAVAPSPKATCR